MVRVGPATGLVVTPTLDGGKRWCPRCKEGQLFREGDEAACLQCGYREDFDAPAADTFAILVAVVQKAAESLFAELQRANERRDEIADKVVRVGRALTALTAPNSETGRKRGYTWSPEAKARQSERMQARRARAKERRD